ncbi:MAG: acyltransferase [Lactobacillaceae bacterium]|jgi:surface polysaccharide O-acyltransferase-like enzyme|nr:acyltransferase [Lactobacillaceae bacterium]
MTRRKYLDYLAIAATIVVVFYHAMRDAMASSGNPRQQLFIGIFQSLLQYGVPLFFMASGAKLLNPKNSNDLKAFLKKRVLRIGVPFLTWNFITYVGVSLFLPSYYGNSGVNGRGMFTGMSFGVIDFFNRLLTNRVMSVYWYIYVLIGLYLLVPILSSFFTRENMKLIQYTFAISLIFVSVLPLIYQLIGVTNPFPVELGIYSQYFILGWLLDRLEFKRTTKIVLVVSGIIVLVWSVFYNYGIEHSTGIFPSDGPFIQLNFLPSVIVSSMLFILLRQLNNIETSQKFDIAAQTGAILTFGVYLSHRLVMGVIGKILPSTELFVTMALIPSVTILLSFAMIYIVSKTPFIKKIFL